ncbi:MAG: PKD domain-containing protein [Thermoanaerobaculia bacterium]|nr:PKD domain-containing protein [Thermoanaerobaculia bacterium]
MKQIFLVVFLILFQAGLLRGETEPNDLADQANPLLYNGSDTGSLSGTDVYDWFYIDLPQAGILQLTIHKTGTGNGWMYLRDGENAALPEITNLYMGYWESPAEGWVLSYPVLPGRYYVQFTKGDYALNYRIVSNLLPPDWAADPEPNNSAGTALTLPVGGIVSGNIHYYGAGLGVDQEDWFVLNVPKGGILQLVVHKKGAGNAWIYLRDGENAALPEIANVYTQYWDSPPEGLLLSYPVLAGRYYVQVANGGGIVNYQIKSTLTPPAWPEDQEPNDDKAAAKPFAMNDSISGLVGYYKVNSGPDPADWYALNVPERGLLRFDITKTGYSNANVRLRDANAEIGGTYLGFGDLTSTFSKTVQAGTYYLVLEKLTDDYQYKVALHFTPAPVAGFTYQQAGNTVAFENTSLEGETFTWNFDDGATGTTVNAYHEYAMPGNYEVCLIAANPVDRDTFCRQVIISGLARAYPDKAGNTGDASLRIFGGGLDTSYLVKLVQGGATIAQSTLTGYGGKSAIISLLDLRNKPTGVYDLVVEKPGGPKYTIPKGFTILPGTSPDPWVSIVGRDRILFNTWTTYTVNYGNKGNVDARLVPVWFVFSNPPDLEIEFPEVFFYDPDSTGTEAPEEGLYMETDSLFGKPFAARVYPLLIPLIPAGTVQSFRIRIKTGGNLHIEAWAEKPWYQSPVDQNKIECFGDALSEAPPELNLTTDKVFCAKLFTALFYDRIMDEFWQDKRNDPNPQLPDFFSSVLKSLRVAVKVCGVSDPEERKEIANWVTNWIINRQIIDRLVQAKGGNQCPLEFAPQNPQSKPLTAVSSLDPNEKTGLQGYGDQHYLAPREELPYVIHFENTASATAPAHTVVITDQLDVSKFDLGTFRFGDIQIAGQRIRADAGARAFVQDFNIENLGVTVRILGALDALSGKVEWVFRSLDPNTLDDIDDPDRGFLPPNLTAPEGEGSVSFSVRLKAVPQQGEQVRNEASIVFDANAPILTNEHFLSFDRVAPQSAVEALPPNIQDHPFPVHWDGSDAGSGIGYYNVYVSENGGPDSLWMAGATETTAIFTGKVGHVYRFYSIATDHVGNIEAVPATADAQTTVTVGANDPDGAGHALTLYPNPAADRVIVQYSGICEGSLTLADHTGRIVRTLHFRGAGQQEMATGNLPAGIYIWSWTPLGPSAGWNGKLMIVR